MVSHIYYEDSVPILYSSPPVFYSKLSEKKLGLKLEWKDWRLRKLELRSDGSLLVRILPSQLKKKQNSIRDKFILKDIIVSELDSSKNIEAVHQNPLLKKEIGIVIKCHTPSNVPTEFRLILDEETKNQLYESIKIVSTSHNLNCIRMNSISQHYKETNISSSPTNFSFLNQSSMRKAFTTAMDNYTSYNTHNKIIRKRGVLKFLPIYFNNDLVHGSWWFFIGSILFFISSLIILINSYNNMLGKDDTILSLQFYRVSWLLMIICAIFSILGSMAFIRAVHTDPPMRPLFPEYYHIQSDELLGSWLFLLAVVPMIPYTLLYIISSYNFMYVVTLPIVLFILLGSYLFVRACYPSSPSEKPMEPLLKPIIDKIPSFLIKKKWRDNHLKNDWLIGTWLIFIGTLIATIGCFFLFFASVIFLWSGVEIFLYGTTLLENIAFLLGSAYFVTGSYEDDDEEGENDDEDINDNENHKEISSDNTIKKSYFPSHSNNPIFSMKEPLLSNDV